MDGDYSPRYRWAVWTLIGSAALLRLAYLAWWCPLDLAPDEAHYWDWSRQLDWGYYSKGPLVAWLIRASCAVLGDNAFAVRVPAVACGALMLAGLHRLTLRVYRSDRPALAVTALALTLPIVTAGSSLMTIDAPFLCAWMWALVFAQRAIFTSAWWAWPAAGACVLIGLLAKHTMLLFVPSLGFFLLATPGFRTLLGQLGFWAMTGVGALAGIPILGWNATNDWAMLRHTSVHVGIEDEAKVHWLGPLAFLGTQFAVLLGFWFVAWARAIWEQRPTRTRRPELAFLWWMSVPTVVFFGLFSLTNGGGEANWPIAGYLAGMVLAAGWIREQWRHAEIWRRRVVQASTLAAVALGVLLTVLIHEPARAQPVLMRIAGTGAAPELPIRRVDPTCRLRGWRHLGVEVDRMRAELAGRGIEPVLAAERWTQAGELAFYCDGQPKVHCLGLLLGDRASQYDLWRPNPPADADAFEGRTFVLVGLGLERLEFAFDAMEPVRTVEYREDGELIATWDIAIAHGYRAN